MKRRNIVSAWLKSVWIALLCTFGIACRQVEPVQEKTLQILNSEMPVSVSLDDMVDSIAFIPLETSDNCLLGYIMSAKRDGNHCFVQDERGLFVFDSKGKFLNEIGHKGDGPEEYHAMDCYGIDRLHKLVWIFCAIERKVIRYNYDGSYHSTLLLDEKDANVSSFRVGDDGTLFAYFPLPNKAMEIDKACCVFRQEDERLVSEKLLDAPALSSGEAYYPYLYYPMATCWGKDYFIAALSNKLYVFKEGKMVAEGVVNLPDILPDESFLAGHAGLEFMELRNVMMKEGQSLGLTAVKSGGDYLLLSVNNLETLVWDGDTGILVSDVFQPDLNSYSNLGLARGMSDEDLDCLDAEFLYSNREQIARNGNSELASLVDSLQEDDNPVLCQYYLKKNLITHLKRLYLDKDGR